MLNMLVAINNVAIQRWINYSSLAKASATCVGFLSNSQWDLELYSIR